MFYFCYVWLLLYNAKPPKTIRIDRLKQNKLSKAISIKVGCKTDINLKLLFAQRKNKTIIIAQKEP